MNNIQTHFKVSIFVNKVSVSHMYMVFFILISKSLILLSTMASTLSVVITFVHIVFVTAPNAAALLHRLATGTGSNRGSLHNTKPVVVEIYLEKQISTSVAHRSLNYIIFTQPRNMSSTLGGI
jgi:hypothetical protein